ncbi:hypothetical protein Aab01nite_64670 [Paractinoplanes abujensis]|uniref:Uncharacterized protein n=1 Tax=Paractinoplanes abujensis TaxID=882441 RepID=A0A7W7CQ16_9ACTN|nr:hypothetical protein [Actinoplanes abujensis]MBB4692622.1 hypothetical protein [Actinoplanes abujensis]GID22877.1 hypothetical protein Aab01nite_64670 [Actinoplanes abujensis]
MTRAPGVAAGLADAVNYADETVGLTDEAATAGLDGPENRRRTWKLLGDLAGQAGNDA